MKLFVSYRRSDTRELAGRVYDRLAQHFGVGSVFKDVDSMPVGADFRAVIQQEIALCDVMLALIGKGWVTAQSASGERRINQSSDFIRLELEAALSRRIPVIPVLADGAAIPTADELPVSLRELAYRNAVALGRDPDFHRDMDRLIRAVESLGGRLPHASPPRSQVPDIDLRDLGSSRVFVSHSSLDRAWVETEVVRPLEVNGIQTWYAPTRIESAAQWEREILRGMERCDWFLLVVSPRAADSEWVKDELNWAVHYRPTRIVPVVMEECNLWQFHIRLPRIQHIDFTREAESARRKLLARFGPT
jgi:hypothetical protein